MNSKDDKLTQAARGLATEISPSRDLWPGIEAAITAPAQTRQTPWYAQAAAVLLLVAVSSLVTYTLVRQEGAEAPPVVAQAPAGEATVEKPHMTFERAAFGGEHTLASLYGRAGGNVESNLDEALSSLSPEARADIERNLAVIRQAIAEISGSLEQEPNNQFLQELLVEAYRNELTLMNRVGSMTQRVMARKDI